MIHCVCLNRAQQWLTAMCLLFSAASEGRIRNLGLGGKIGTFLGPFWYFGPIWDQVPNSGPYRSACMMARLTTEEESNQVAVLMKELQYLKVIYPTWSWIVLLPKIYYRKRRVTLGAPPPGWMLKQIFFGKDLVNLLLSPSRVGTGEADCPNRILKLWKSDNLVLMLCRIILIS